MNVGQLRQALANYPDHLPVVIEQEDLELVGVDVELMSVECRDDLVYFDPKEFSLDGSRPYSRPEWGYRDTTPTESVVIVGCKPRRPDAVDGEVLPTRRELDT